MMQVLRSPRFLVTAAVGNTGYPTALRLLDQGERVRVLIRRSSARSETLRRHGAEIVLGSLDDIGDVRAALDDVQRAYFCAPLLPGLLDKAVIFASAADDAGVEFVVALSQWLADPTHPSIHTRQAWLAEQVLRRAAVDVCVVNPGWFADNYLASTDLITQLGLLPLPLGEGLNAPPSNEDIGAVVAAVLRAPAAHVDRAYRPTGPALLDPQQIAATFATVTGHPVRYVNAPLGTFARVSRGLGLPDYTTAQVLHYFADYQRNAFGIGGPTDVVPELTGRPAESLETIARRYFTPAVSRRTLSTRVAASGRLLRGLLRGSADTRVISRTDDYAIPHLRLAAESDTWRLTHDRDHPGVKAPARTNPSAASSAG
jgi:NAD(P)H dehydrogenase (quinone)